MSEKTVAPINTLARYEPDTVYIGTGEYVAECVRADDGDYYLAADVDAATATLQAEIEGLREQLRLAGIDQATAEAEANDAHAENKRLREALEDIRSLSFVNSAMRPNPLTLTALLGDIHQIADAALEREETDDAAK